MCIVHYFLRKLDELVPRLFLNADHDLEKIHVVSLGHDKTDDDWRYFRNYSFAYLPVYSHTMKVFEVDVPKILFVVKY